MPLKGEAENKGHRKVSEEIVFQVIRAAKHNNQNERIL